eukprot:4189112-Amphidinium_carterae.1
MEVLARQHKWPKAHRGIAFWTLRVFSRRNTSNDAKRRVFQTTVVEVFRQRFRQSLRLMLLSAKPTRGARHGGFHTEIFRDTQSFSEYSQ